MKKGKKSNLMGLVWLIMVWIFVTVLASCESMTMDRMSTESGDTVVPPHVDPELDFDLTRQEWNRGWNYESLYEAVEKNTNTREQGRLYAEVSHQSDRYAVAEKYRNISPEYSNAHLTIGDVKVKTSGDGSRSVFNYSQRFTFETECGNLLYLDWNGERVSREFNGKRAMMPADSLKSVRIVAINTLPGNTKYNRTRADEYVADSVVREVVYDLTLTTVGLPQNQEFHRELRDSFRVLLLAANDIDTAYAISKQRDVIDEKNEKCSFIEIFKMKDGSEHENPRSIILTREIITKPEYEMIVKSFDFRHLSDGNVIPGSVSVVETKDNWTVRECIDAFSGMASNGIEPINTDYKFRHQGATYKDEFLEVEFELVTPTMAERSTWVEDATSPRGGYNAKRFQNAIQTSYLGYNQDAAESVLLLMEQAHIIHQDWDKDKCKETIYDDRTEWHLEFITDFSDGTQDRKVFDFSDVRSLENLGPWESIEDNNNNSTSSVSVKLTKTEPVSKTKDGCTASWNREYRDMESVTTLNASTQRNRWRSQESNNFKAEYQGKPFSFEANTLNVANANALSAAVEKDGYTCYDFSDILRYIWGSSIKESTGNGLIKVSAPAEKTFFPPEWGRLYEAKQTNTNNVKHNGSVYVWSLHFEKGVLPVIVQSGSTPDWNQRYFEYTSNHDYNSASYVDGTWVNSIASDQFTMMTWNRGNVEKGNKDYSIAESQNWDEGRMIDGHCSVYTSRYSLQVEDGRLTATDTYTGSYLGSWK